MGFTKIQDSDLSGIGVIGLPDTPGLSTAAMQSKFEETSRSVVIPKHNELIDELEASASANSLGATPVTGRISAPTVQAVMEKLSVDLKTVEDGMAGAIAQAHSHNNKAELDKFSEDTSGKPLYDGNPIGETDYDNLSNQPQINGVTLTGNKSSSDLGINIPDELADLADDGNHRLVTDSEKSSWSAKLGDAIKKITVNSTTIDASGEQEVELAAGSNVTIVANTSTTPPKITISSTGGGGGGGGGDMYKSEFATNGTTGVVDKAQTLDGLTASISDLNDIEKKYATTDSASTDIDDGDYFPFFDTSVAEKKQSLWSNIKAKLKTYFDGIYSTVEEVDDLDDVNISGATDGQVITYDSVNSEWVNADPATGGHVMIPVTNDISTIANLPDGTDNYVLNAYSAKRYSNTEIVTLYAEIDAGDDTIGTWTDTWKTDGDRSGWIWHSCLYNILSDDEVEIEPVFDMGHDELVSLYAFRIDDNVTNSGVDGGAIAFKLNGAVKYNGLKIGIRIKRQRTEVIDCTNSRLP